MKFTLPRVLALFACVAIGFFSGRYLRPIPESKPLKSQEQLLDAAIELIQDRQEVRASEGIVWRLDRMKDELYSTRRAVARAYEAAARIRQEHQIIDPGPESAQDFLSISDRAPTKSDASVAEYNQAKRRYLEAKDHMMKLEQIHGATNCGWFDPFQREVDSTAKATADAFAEVSNVLQTGTITDPNPDDPKSALSFDRKDQQTADQYIALKTTYLAQKRRLDSARLNYQASIVTSSRNEATEAYQAVTILRQERSIIDPNPDNADAIVSPQDHPNVAEYSRLKKIYLEIETEIEIADRVLPVEFLQNEASTSEKEKADAFAKITEILQSGKVTDPNPDVPHSAVSSDAESVTAIIYRGQKSDYLAKSRRLMRAQKALDAAKSRKVPSTAVTK